MLFVESTVILAHEAFQFGAVMIGCGVMKVLRRTHRVVVQLEASSYPGSSFPIIVSTSLGSGSLVSIFVLVVIRGLPFDATKRD